jgi:hypothetical protein
MALQPPLDRLSRRVRQGGLVQNDVRRSSRSATISKGADGVGCLENARSRALPTNRTLRDQRKMPISSRPLGLGGEVRTR